MKTQSGSELTGTEMAQMLDEWCNANRQSKDFVEQVTMRTHRTLQQKMMGLFVSVIEAWSEDRGGHDARNQATVELAKKMIQGTGDKYDRALPFI